MVVIRRRKEENEKQSFVVFFFSFLFSLMTTMTMMLRTSRKTTAAKSLCLVVACVLLAQAVSAIDFAASPLLRAESPSWLSGSSLSSFSFPLSSSVDVVDIHRKAVLISHTVCSPLHTAHSTHTRTSSRPLTLPRRPTKGTHRKERRVRGQERGPSAGETRARWREW